MNTNTIQYAQSSSRHGCCCTVRLTDRTRHESVTQEARTVDVFRKEPFTCPCPVWEPYRQLAWAYCTSFLDIPMHSILSQRVSKYHTLWSSRYPHDQRITVCMCLFRREIPSYCKNLSLVRVLIFTRFIHPYSASNKCHISWGPLRSTLPELLIQYCKLSVH